MGHSIGDGLIVASLAATLSAYLYFKHVERRRRLEIVHQERMAAIEKGIPLPELPLDPTRTPRPADPREPLLHGIVWTALGTGGMAGLMLFPTSMTIWPLTLPLMFLGVGLVLYYVLASRRPR
jgi:hypothetical protein